MEVQSEYFMLYPVYIDSCKTYSKGRKYSKSICVDKPLYAEIFQALKALEIECIPEPTKRHPRDFFNYGRFKIKKMYGKKQVIEGIRQMILEKRENNIIEASMTKCSEKPANYIKTSSGEVIENKLNLVAKKKNKNKKGKKK